jgi:hypothetical protein
MCEEMLFMKTTVCKKGSMERSYVYQIVIVGVHGIIFMNKPLDFLLK